MPPLTPLPGPFRHINRDGYGSPWIVQLDGFEYAVGYVDDGGTRPYCAVITRKPDEATVLTVAQNHGFECPEDADQWAKAEIKRLAAKPKSPESINSPHVKVVKTGNGLCMPQFTTDQLYWFNLLRMEVQEEFAISVAVAFAEATRAIPACGKTTYEVA